MAKIKRIVTSEVEGRNLSDFYGDNSYSFDTSGQINYYGQTKMGPVIEPGVVYGSNADSADGYGLNTIKLIPHAPEGQVYDDRYLIIDPTFPNHIHIRPGGTIDQSNAELILGGEKNFVKIDDGSRVVTISSKEPQSVQAVLNINFESNEYMVFNDVVPVSNNGWYTEVNGIRYYVADVTYPTEGQTQVYVPGATFQSQGVYNMFSPEISSQWQFDGEGIIYGPGDGAETTFTKIATLSTDGSGQNVKIGDDAWIGDVNVANHIGIKGLQNPTQAGIILGNPSTGTISVAEDNLAITSEGTMTIEAVGGDMNFYMDGGMYIGPSNSDNQIIKRSDLVPFAPPVETLFTVNGGTLGTQPTFNGAPLFTGSYVIHGPLVHFQIQVDMDNITDFGSGQYFVDLPFPAKYGYQVREGCLHDFSTGRQYSIGGHVFAGQSRLALSYTDTNGQDSEFDYNSPVALSTADNFHISGSYIAIL